MINIQKTLDETSLPTKLIMQLLDELVFDIPVSEPESVKPTIDEPMRTTITNLKLPILVEMGVGMNRREAHRSGGLVRIFLWQAQPLAGRTCPTW